MAEEQDDSQKTEAPSQRRLDEAREKGQLAVSREVATCLAFGLAALLAWSMAPQLGQKLTLVGRAFLAQPHLMPVDQALAPLLAHLAGELGLVTLGPLLAFLLAPVAAAILQNAVVWTSEPLQPKLERISPLAGLKRLLGLKALVEFLKSLLKAGLVSAALVLLLQPELARLADTAHQEPAQLLGRLSELSTRLLLVLTVVAAAIAGLDYAYQRFEHLRGLRMSRQDLLDELRQSEGDPHLKQRLRAIRLERARRRMMAEVPKSTVVITNPTHVAVALRYAAGETPAPKVVAMGVDGLALRIREVARAHGVPVIESPPLARALLASCEIGELIPPAHYQAVAEIIGYVLGLGERR